MVKLSAKNQKIYCKHFVCRCCTTVERSYANRALKQTLFNQVLVHGSKFFATTNQGRIATGIARACASIGIRDSATELKILPPLTLAQPCSSCTSTTISQ